MTTKERERGTGSRFILLSTLMHLFGHLSLSLYLSRCVCAKTCIKDAARYGFVDEEKRREERRRGHAWLTSSSSSRRSPSRVYGMAIIPL